MVNWSMGILSRWQCLRYLCLTVVAGERFQPLFRILGYRLRLVIDEPKVADYSNITRIESCSIGTRCD